LKRGSHSVEEKKGLDWGRPRTAHDLRGAWTILSLEGVKKAYPAELQGISLTVMVLSLKKREDVVTEGGRGQTEISAGSGQKKAPLFVLGNGR